MNGKRAKHLRGLIYGTDYSPRARKYYFNGVTIFADKTRRAYQTLKRRYVRETATSKYPAT